MLSPVLIHCPYCGEPIEILVDPSAGNQQQYVEDCQVCCQPMLLSVAVDDEGEVRVDVTTENGE